MEILGLNFDMQFILILENILTYAILGVYIVNDIRKEIKPRAYVLRVHNNTYYRVFTKFLNKNEQSFSFANKIYKIDWNNPAFHIIRYWHHIPIFIYLEKYPLPLTIQSEYISIGKDFEKQLRKFYNLVKEKAIEQLVKASSEQILSWTLVIVFIVLTACASFMLGMFVYPYIHPAQPVIVNATQVG